MTTAVIEPMDIMSFDIGIKNMCFCILHPGTKSSPFSIIDWNIINLMENPETFQETVVPICSSCTKKAKFMKNVNLPSRATEKASKNIVSSTPTLLTENVILPSQASEKPFIHIFDGGIAEVKNEFFETKCRKNIYYCLKHAKTSNYLLPSKQFTKGSLHKLKKKDLILFCHSKLFFIDSITKEPIENLSKPQLVDAAVAYFINCSLLPVTFSSSTEENLSGDADTNASTSVKIKKKVAGNTDLVEIGWNMKKHLDKISDSVIKNIKYVIIENQISPIANRMKTIQGMLAQYFIMRCDKSNLFDGGIAEAKNENRISINFVSSKNKLKGFVNLPSRATANLSSLSQATEKPSNSFEQNTLNAFSVASEDKLLTEKQKYKQNKNNAIIYCTQILETNENMLKDWGWTMKMAKKDDYADSFLQGYWFSNTLEKE
jgi:hypothetical protein